MKESKFIMHGLSKPDYVVVTVENRVELAHKAITKDEKILMAFLFDIKWLDVNITSLYWFLGTKPSVLLGLMCFNEFRGVQLVLFAVYCKYDFWSKFVTAVHISSQFIILIEVLLSSVICPRREGNRRSTRINSHKTVFVFVAKSYEFLRCYFNCNFG